MLPKMDWKNMAPEKKCLGGFKKTTQKPGYEHCLKEK